MLKLSDRDKMMLDGKMGAFRGKAMEFIVRYGEILGAQELCSVSRATLFIGAQHYLDCYAPDTDYGKIFSQFYLCSHEAVGLEPFDSGCKVQTCAAACDLFDYEKTHLSREYHERNRAYLEITKAMGAKIVDSCAPYFVGWIPLMGEHFVSTESSNVVVSNSVFAAMGNSDGVEAAVCSAVTGRTPMWGMHVPENRTGNCLVYVDFPFESVFDWDVVGFTVGRMIPKHTVPILTGLFERPDINRLRQFCSSISVTSATELCHIPGVTPEAHTLQMCTRGASHEIKITMDDYNRSLEMISSAGSGSADYISIGCPHLALDEIKEIAEYMDGKRVKAGAELLVWTDYATRAMADVNGYTSVIEDSGAYLLTGSCPVVMREKSHSHAAGMVMNGSKQAFSIRHQTKVPVYFGDIRECLDAAVSGFFRRRGA